MDRKRHHAGQGSSHQSHAKRTKYNENQKCGTSFQEERYYHGQMQRKAPIMHMPSEVIQRIFSYIAFEDLGSISVASKQKIQPDFAATSVRLVNRRFRVLAQDILNRRFTSVEPRLNFLKHMVKTSIEHSKEDLERRCLCKILNVIEILIFHVNVPY